MSTLGATHLIFSLIAIAAGTVVMLVPKGTRWHRTVGHLYGTAMVGVLVTALSIYELTGGWGPFHFAAVLGAVTLAGGLYTVLLRRPKREWIQAHAIWMSWSYIGLMAAFFAESFTRFVMPRVAPYFQGTALWGVFWTAVVVVSAGTFVVGWWLVRTRLPGAVAGTPAAMRQERERLTRLDAARQE